MLCVSVKVTPAPLPRYRQGSKQARQLERKEKKSRAHPRNWYSRTCFRLIPRACGARVRCIYISLCTHSAIAPSQCVYVCVCLSCVRGSRDVPVVTPASSIKALSLSQPLVRGANYGTYYTVVCSAMIECAFSGETESGTIRARSHRTNRHASFTRHVFIGRSSYLYRYRSFHRQRFIQNRRIERLRKDTFLFIKYY